MVRADPTPRQSLSFSRKNASFAKAVGSFVPGLTRKSFEKYGFSTATLLTDWMAIVGQDLAAFTLPERLKWPRNVESFEETRAGARGRPGATLVLRVDGPRAIEVQYRTTQIMERINAHFGYCAVSEIRFIQAPLPKSSRETPRTATGLAQTRAGASCGQPDRDNSGSGDALLAALDRLHANMTRAGSA
ncbi:MAG: DUF721 domain-containing protein [Alphaproteobacteria bacterium]|nr:DUF721 domain-containing protein [Alphaproteobacteria bacterium]